MHSQKSQDRQTLERHFVARTSRQARTTEAKCHRLSLPEDREVTGVGQVCRLCMAGCARCRQMVAPVVSEAPVIIPVASFEIFFLLVSSEVW